MKHKESILYSDLYRYEGKRAGSLFVKLRYVFFTPGYTFTVFFRKASNSKCAVLGFVWKLFFHVTKVITGIQIPTGTKIGPGLKIGHFGAIVINPDRNREEL